jgi:hypothetical protein
MDAWRPKHVEDSDIIKWLWKWKCIKLVTFLWARLSYGLLTLYFNHTVLLHLNLGLESERFLPVAVDNLLTIFNTILAPCRTYFHNIFTYLKCVNIYLSDCNVDLNIRMFGCSGSISTLNTWSNFRVSMDPCCACSELRLGLEERNSFIHKKG